MNPCRQCGKPTGPRGRKKNDFLCNDCFRKYKRGLRDRHRSNGITVTGGKASKDWWKAYTTTPEQLRKSAVRAKLRRAVTAGKIEKLPCDICGSSKVEAHHQDYNKPFDVVWLCRRHHGITRQKAEGQAHV